MSSVAFQDKADICQGRCCVGQIQMTVNGRVMWDHTSFHLNTELNQHCVIGLAAKPYLAIFRDKNCWMQCTQLEGGLQLKSPEL